MTKQLGNPYGGLDTATESADGRSVYLYSELPDACPSCGHQFSQVHYRRLYPRRFRVHTLLFFALLLVCGLFVGVAMIYASPLAAWALTWNKKVTVRCLSCGWTRKYVVSVRGYRA